VRAYDAAVNTRDAARRWAQVWERGWRTRDAAAILALYAPGATLRSHPFRDAVAPADYIVPTLAEEAAADCSFAEPLLVDGDRAVVEWRGETTLRDGGSERLAGVSLLRFDDDGLVVEQRDFWGVPPT
jgi:hypothetical protein